MSSDPTFLRRQAEKFLKQAEFAERLAPLAALPANSIVIFVRKGWNGRPLAYAGIVIENPDPKEHGPYAGRKWYVTNAGTRMGPYTDETFIDWLIEGDVKDFEVVTASSPLDELDISKLNDDPALNVHKNWPGIQTEKEKK